MISKCFSLMLTKVVIELEIEGRNSTLIKISLPFLTDGTLSSHATLLSVQNIPYFNEYKAIVRSKLCIQPQQ